MSRTPRYEVVFSATRYVSFERVTRNRIHRHSFFEPCIVISGTGEFEHRSEVYALEEGALFIADPGIYHEIRSLDAQDLKLYFLAFNLARNDAAKRPADEPWLDPQALARFALEHKTHVAGQSQLTPLFEHVARLSRRRGEEDDCPFYREASLLLVSQIVAALAEAPGVNPGRRRDEMLRRRVVEVIEERLHDLLRVPMVAAQCNMSERTLRRRWRDVSGRSMVDEVSRRRVERAKHLLLLAGMSISEVGYQVGIASPSNFARTFKNVTGLSPKAYRDRHLGGPALVGASGPPFRTEFLDGDTKEYRV